jgi:hypothetical protein
VSFTIYWDEDVADEPWDAWIDEAINHLGAHEKPLQGDSLETPADEGVVVLVASNPHNKKDRRRITLVSGEDEKGQPSLVVSRIAKS